MGGCPGWGQQGLSGSLSRRRRPPTPSPRGFGCFLGGSLTPAPPPKENPNFFPQNTLGHLPKLPFTDSRLSQSSSEPPKNPPEPQNPQIPPPRARSGPRAVAMTTERRKWRHRQTLPPQRGRFRSRAKTGSVARQRRAGRFRGQSPRPWRHRRAPGAGAGSGPPGRGREGLGGSGTGPGGGSGGPGNGARALWS